MIEDINFNLMPDECRERQLRVSDDYLRRTGRGADYTVYFTTCGVGERSTSSLL